MEKQVVEFAREAISISVATSQEKLSTLGVSKLGGCPDVSEEFEWPRDDKGHLLSLLMQVNCSDVAHLDATGVLPTSGQLLFFYEMEKQDWEGGKGSVRLIYVDGQSTLHREPFPDDLSDKHRIAERALRFAVRTSYPTFEDYITLLGADDDYDALEETFNENVRRLGEAYGSPDGEIGTMLGYADLVQNYIVDDLENNVLLLQLYSTKVDDTSLMFGDDGKVFYYVYKESLLSKRFDKLKFEMQCY